MAPQAPVALIPHSTSDAMPQAQSVPTAPVPKVDVFDLFPCALMVCDRRGRIVAGNARFREIITAGRAVDGLAMSCCSLLGCRRADGPLEGSCLTALALDAGETLTEVRVHLTAARPGAYLAAAAPLYKNGSHVVIELRPARRSLPACPGLRIFTLGGLLVEGPDGPITGEWLEQRPGQLLRYLVCERGKVAPVDAIAEAICPHTASAGASNNVRYLIHTLRARLEPGRPWRGEPSFVVSRRGGYALDPERVWIDADALEQRIDAGMAALTAGDHAGARQHLRRAVSLYDGSFLADEPYAEWALGERDRLDAITCDALRALARLHVDDPSAAMLYLERLAGIEPLDDDVQRQLISTWLRLGRKSRAVRQYYSFRTRLMREFGERPSFELSHLVPDCAPRSRVGK
jgi:SARP family transcriptional regulator, regulator of embCAB operon